MQHLTAKELCAKLAIDGKQLAAFVREGLPCKGRGKKRRFDPAAVAAWLQKSGKLQSPAAAVPGQVVTTRAEAARVLGVSLRTLAEWMTSPTFPGTAGHSGRQDGYFPIDEIRAWRSATLGSSGGSPADAELLEARRLKLRIDNDRAQIALEKELKSLGDTEAMARFAQRQIATAKALLGEMADKVESRLPAKVERPLRQVIRKAIEEVLAETLNAIAEMALGDQDETDDAPDDHNDRTEPPA